jgi:hypothetical protein
MKRYDRHRPGDLGTRSKRPFCLTTNAIDAMDVFTEQLPHAVYSNSTIGKYRDAVCQHFHLRLKRINGNGNCFFESCAALLPTVSDANALRRQVVAFLRECVHGEHGALGERCLCEIEAELNEELIGGKKKIFPLTAEAYLNASACSRIWVAGYHWVRAVSALHNVCIGVVIHGFEHVTFFGDPSLPRSYLYKKDALPPPARVALAAPCLQSRNKYSPASASLFAHQSLIYPLK